MKVIIIKKNKKNKINTKHLTEKFHTRKRNSFGKGATADSERTSKWPPVPGFP